MSGSDNFPGSGEFFPAELPRRGAPETAQFSQGAGFRAMSLPLDAGFTDFEIKVKGNQFWIVDTTDLEVSANVKFNETSGQGVPVAKGFALKGIPFSRIYISAAAQAGKSITLLTTFINGAPVEFVNPTNSANEVKLLKGTTLATSSINLAGNVNTVIYPANPNRLSTIVENISANIMFFGEDTGFGLFGTGLKLNPGDTFIIDQAPAAELRGIAALGGSVKVFEELR